MDVFHSGNESFTQLSAAYLATEQQIEGKGVGTAVGFSNICRDSVCLEISYTHLPVAQTHSSIQVWEAISSP